MIRFLTAGESHGKACNTIIEGAPSGLCVPMDEIERDLIRRQAGYCRGWRQAVEKNTVDITSGIHDSITTGAPVNIVIYNTEGVNNPVWQKALGAYPADTEGDAVTLAAAIKEKQRSVFIPGHADLPGIIKYRHRDNNLRYISDRASARETIVRVAVGTIARLFLARFGISLFSYVTRIGNAECDAKFDVEAPDIVHNEVRTMDEQIIRNFRQTCNDIEQRGLTIFGVTDKVLSGNRGEIIGILNNNLAELSDCAKVKCPDGAAAAKMVAEIDDARGEGDTVGGIIKVTATGLPPGLGSYVHCDKRLSSRIAAAVLGMPAVKGVEFGRGFEAARMRGSELHDPIRLNGKGFFARDTNNAGGVEGGMTNSEPLVVNVAIKPISMISKKAVTSVDLSTGKETTKTSGERADVCAVPSATVIGESLVAIELANAMIEKFGGDHISETLANYNHYMSYVGNFYSRVEGGT